MKTKQFSLKGFSVELYKRIEAVAKENHRSVTQEIYAALEAYVREREKEKAREK